MPGFLICDNHASVARLGYAGRLVVPVAPDLPAILNRLELPAGRWLVEADASRPSLHLRVSPPREGDAPGPVLLDARTPAVLDWGGGPLRVELLAPDGQAVEVHKLTFTRADE